MSVSSLLASDLASAYPNGSTALSSESNTAGSPFAQDLQSFVQDLFSVLHQTSSTHTKSSGSIGKPAPKGPNTITPHINASASSTVASAAASESGESTAAKTTTGKAAVGTTTTTDSATASSTTTAGTAATSTGTVSTTSSKAGQYQLSGTKNIIAASFSKLADLQNGSSTSGKLIDTKA